MIISHSQTPSAAKRKPCTSKPHQTFRLNLSKGLYFDESSPHNPAQLKLKSSYLTTWPHRNAQVRSHSLHSLAAPFSTPELRIKWNQSEEQFDSWSTTTRVIPHQTPNSINGLFQLSFVDLSFHLFHWFQPSITSRARFAVLQIRSQSIYLLQLSLRLSFQLLLSNRICFYINLLSHHISLAQSRASTWLLKDITTTRALSIHNRGQFTHRQRMPLMGSSYGPPQNYGPPQGYQQGYGPPQGGMQYQQPQQVIVKQKKDRGCLGAW